MQIGCRIDMVLAAADDSDLTTKQAEDWLDKVIEVTESMNLHLGGALLPIDVDDASEYNSRPFVAQSLEEDSDPDLDASDIDADYFIQQYESLHPDGPALGDAAPEIF